MKTLKILLALSCVICFTACEKIGSAPSSVAGKTMKIDNTSSGTLTIRFSSNTSASISNNNGEKSFKSIQYKKTGATTASITIKDMYVQFNWKSGTGVAYDTEYISLVFNSSTQGVSSGYWERRNVSGETGSSSGDIDASQFTLF